MATELRDIAGKSCPEIAWVNSDVTADGMSDLVVTAECGFFAAAQLRRRLIENAVPELGAGPGQRVLPPAAPTPPERRKMSAGPGLAPDLVSAGMGPSGTSRTCAGCAVGVGTFWWPV